MRLAHVVTPIAAAGLAAMSGAASAEMEWWQMDQPAFFVGAGVGYDWLRGGKAPNQPDDVKGSNVTYKIPFGWRYNQTFGVEGQYINFGTNDDNSNNRIDADGWTAELTAGVPISPHFVPYAKAGVLFWNSDRRYPIAPASTTQREVDGNGTDFAWGVGAKFPMTEMIDFRLEYERFQFGDIEHDNGSGTFDHTEGAKANMASAMVVFNFGPR